MKNQEKVNGSLALKSPCVVVIPANTPEQTRKLRVAAYARVSSNSEDQLNSFAAQNAHYTELITSNPDWEFVDVYADRGSLEPPRKSGTTFNGSWRTAGEGGSTRSWSSPPPGLPETPRNAWKPFGN